MGNHLRRPWKLGLTSKYEVYVRKKGGKKLILTYDETQETIFVITGAEGKS